MEPDKTDIEQFRQGNVRAFEKIFHAYYKPLSRYACTMLKNMDEAEDTVHQMFVSVWEKRETLEVHTSLKALLYRSVHNACLNLLKQKKVRSEYAKEVVMYAEVATVQESLQKKELELKIEAALNSLPEQCGKIFKMSRFEQLKYQEIADQLNISVKTVENQMGKALKIMREQLKDYLPIAIIILSRYYSE